mmetsp:Transcript_17224/g.23683  ORF Transcript_17224/g.23683 Transcript_17224/m.23683 type:complete len:128 (+) Transcript_17224:735-1118(+)
MDILRLRHNECHGGLLCNFWGGLLCNYCRRGGYLFFGGSIFMLKMTFPVYSLLAKEKTHININHAKKIENASYIYQKRYVGRILPTYTMSPYWMGQQQEKNHTCYAFLIAFWKYLAGNDKGSFRKEG